MTSKTDGEKKKNGFTRISLRVTMRTLVILKKKKKTLLVFLEKKKNTLSRTPIERQFRQAFTTAIVNRRNYKKKKKN